MFNFQELSGGSPVGCPFQLGSGLEIKYYWYFPGKNQPLKAACICTDSTSLGYCSICQKSFSLVNLGRHFVSHNVKVLPDPLKLLSSYSLKVRDEKRRKAGLPYPPLSLTQNDQGDTLNFLWNNYMTRNSSYLI